MKFQVWVTWLDGSKKMVGSYSSKDAAEAMVKVWEDNKNVGRVEIKESSW